MHSSSLMGKRKQNKTKRKKKKKKKLTSGFSQSLSREISENSGIPDFWFCTQSSIWYSGTKAASQMEMGTGRRVSMGLIHEYLVTHRPRCGFSSVLISIVGFLISRGFCAPPHHLSIGTLKLCSDIHVYETCGPCLGPPKTQSTVKTCSVHVHHQPTVLTAPRLHWAPEDGHNPSPMGQFSTP